MVSPLLTFASTRLCMLNIRTADDAGQTNVWDRGVLCPGMGGMFLGLLYLLSLKFKSM